MLNEPPRRISSRLVPVNISGYFMPVLEDGQSYILRMPQSPLRYIAVFEKKIAVKQLWRDYDLSPYARLAVVMDGRLLIEEMTAANQPDLRLIVNPYKHSSGLMRWIELPLAGELPSPT